MGYSTEFEGQFDFNKKLDDETYNLLKGLAETRRMKRKVDSKYGIEGEFYINNDGDFGQTHEKNIIDYNESPKTQPSLWLDWTPTEDRLHLEWGGQEKFYFYVEWLEYIIKIIKPKGYTLNGIIRYRGESMGDNGVIIVKDNEIKLNEIGDYHEK